MKDTICIITFGGLLLIILIVLSTFLNGRFWYTNGYVENRDARYAGIELEEEGQIDVLNVGTSLCDVSISPLELFRDYGITCYNMGRDLQSKSATYYAVKTALRRQKIKVLLWETDNLCKHMDDMTPYRQEISEFSYYHFPVLRYHNCWANWLSGKKHDTFFKGFQIRREMIKPELEENYRADCMEGTELDYETSEEKELTFKMDQMYAFKRIYNLCKANNIQLILYSAPSIKYYPNRRRHNALVALAARYGIDYTDANQAEDAIGIDWNRDSFDGGAHLNLSGSRKMTRYMGEYLSGHCNLQDHRGDPAYADWEDMDSYYAECGE